MAGSSSSDGSSPDRTCLPRERRSGLIHIAPISAGCLGNCAYCIVKVARGRLYSFPVEGILADARAAIASGCKEIWVTAEDTAAYDYRGREAARISSEGSAGLRETSWCASA